jgi:coproporphyrinogen III oxidase-like Fe-S oxidoreductase
MKHQSNLLRPRTTFSIAGTSRLVYRAGMRYHGTVIRPPSEADSYILQVTYGCSHNHCTFCGTYLDKPFQARPLDDVRQDIALARKFLPDTRRVFLADGNALVLSPRRLMLILDELAAAFPSLQRVAAYANARDLLQKSRDELKLLREKGLRLVYLGLESGHDEVLRRINKGATAAEMIEAVQRTQVEGIRISVIGLLGIAGPELSAAHAEATGRVVSAMDPRYLSLLTLMLVPGTPLHQQWRQGTFQLLESDALLSELRQIILCLEGLSGCIFRTNHASNYLPLAGTLPKDKPRLLTTLDAAICSGRAALRPEAWRAL